MEQELWQDVWQTLEITYDAVRDFKGQGDRFSDLAIDSILDHLDAAQCVCERNGATVPVEE